MGRRLSSTVRHSRSAPVEGRRREHRWTSGQGRRPERRGLSRSRGRRRFAGFGTTVHPVPHSRRAAGPLPRRVLWTQPARPVRCSTRAARVTGSGAPGAPATSCPSSTSPEGSFASAGADGASTPPAAHRELDPNGRWRRLRRHHRGPGSRPAGPPVVLAAGDSQVLAVAGGAARTAGDEWKQHRARPRADQGRPLGQPPTTGTGRQKS